MASTKLYEVGVKFWNILYSIANQWRKIINIISPRSVLSNGKCLLLIRYPTETHIRKNIRKNPENKKIQTN